MTKQKFYGNCPNEDCGGRFVKKTAFSDCVHDFCCDSCEGGFIMEKELHKFGDGIRN